MERFPVVAGYPDHFRLAEPVLRRLHEDARGQQGRPGQVHIFDAGAGDADLHRTPSHLLPDPQMEQPGDRTDDAVYAAAVFVFHRLSCVFLLGITAKIFGFFLAIFGKVLGFFFTLAGYLLLGVLGVVGLGLAVFLIPVLLVIGVIALLRII